MRGIKGAIGQLGEDAAVAFLKRNGFLIITRNFRVRNGEVDIIAIENKKEKTLVFIEVKTRTSGQFGTPGEAITYFKLQALQRTAVYYKQLHPRLPDMLRIDAIEIFLSGETITDIRHVKNISM